MTSNTAEDAIQELNAHALHLVRCEPRHDEESLFIALERAFPSRAYPELEQDHFEAAIKAAL